MVHALQLTWAVPPGPARALLPAGLGLDTHRGTDGREWALLAATVAEVEALRPRGTPRSAGRPRHVTVDYRLFATLAVRRGRTVRGMLALAGQSDDPLAVLGANLTSRGGRRRVDARVERTPRRLRISVGSGDGSADLEVVADLDGTARPGTDALPERSVFAGPRTARRFGPLPRTFLPDPAGVVVVEAAPDLPPPAAVAVAVPRATFLEHGPLAGVEHRLSAAFLSVDVDQTWGPGRLHLPTGPDPLETYIGM
nr:DUF2071 domain-containing protein [Auraticoccus cholistanensis]